MCMCMYICVCVCVCGGVIHGVIVTFGGIEHAT